jgi:hypothetical protein
VLLLVILAFASSVGHYELRKSLEKVDFSDTSSHPFTFSNQQIGLMLALGENRLQADICWLAFIQYLGTGKNLDAEETFVALDAITKLDPHFVLPYYFAAFVLGGDLKRPDMAQRLIERGIQENQTNWYLPFIAGINAYLFDHKHDAAARYYRIAAKFPDAPHWLSRQAGILETEIPKLVKDVNTWDTIFRTSQDSMVKVRAKEHLARLWFEVLKDSPTEQIRKRARVALAELGIELR